MIKYIIFDMDGTLFDTEPYYESTWSDTGDKWGHPELREIYSSEIAGRSVDIVKDYLKERYDEAFDPDAFFDERWVLFKQRVSEGVKEKNGCYELLSYLKENNIKAAMATSTSNDIASLYLYKSKLPDYLDSIVFGDEVKRGKPYPDIFLEAGKRIGAKADETLVVGDSSYDMLGGHAAGMRPVMVIDRNPPSEEAAKVCYKVLNSLFEVKELVKYENNL